MGRKATFTQAIYETPFQKRCTKSERVFLNLPDIYSVHPEPHKAIWRHLLL